ncbi:MAG: sulfotransferase family 2 domain-containing protein [Halioglobus sp.]|nr:sulfotransferase family 2 domain-containing protein [Halioglobus sp.]
MLNKGGFYRQRFKQKYGAIGGEECINLCHERELYFVHNPKCAGTSIRHVLELDSVAGADHRTPTNSVHPQTWERYTTIVVVRHPIDRLCSSWKYHTSDSYTGLYWRSVPNLRKFSLKEYFNEMQRFRRCIIPQWNYVYHEWSTAEVDHICKFENLESDFGDLAKKLGYETDSLPTLNASSRSLEKEMSLESDSFWADVVSYYQQDFELFGYSVP